MTVLESIFVNFPNEALVGATLTLPTPNSV